MTRPGGVVSAITCFCHHDGLPGYRGRYPFPGDNRINDLAHKLWQVWLAAVRPDLLGVEHSVPTLDLVWQFRAAGLLDIQVNGHLKLISPGDGRIPSQEAAAYALLQHQKWLERLDHWRNEYGGQLAEAGFTAVEFEELIHLSRTRYEYLRDNPGRVREIMEVFVDPLLIAQGARSSSSYGQAG